jgi:hypothetical protein
MGSMMKFALFAATGIALAAMPLVSQAQITVSIGAEPACPYGYYDYAPYRCSPRGYYGPQYFNSGVFIGVGPWFHGASSFHGTVNNHYDPQHGYKGRMPSVGDKPEAAAKAQPFKGNEERDGRGNVAGGKGGKK